MSKAAARAPSKSVPSPFSRGCGSTARRSLGDRWMTVEASLSLRRSICGIATAPERIAWTRNTNGPSDA
eukprot:2989439-Rhodomonas_salina.2